MESDRWTDLQIFEIRIVDAKLYCVASGVAISLERFLAVHLLYAQTLRLTFYCRKKVATNSCYNASNKLPSFFC